MSEGTKIQWADDTANFWEGCTKVSAGCTNCYAEARDKRFTGGLHWGKGAPRRLSKSAFKDVLRWNKKPWVCQCGVQRSGDQVSWNNVERLTAYCSNCHELGAKYHRRRVFSLSLGDWLDDEVQTEWLAEMLDVIRRCPNLDFLLLTKRPENFIERLEDVMIYLDNHRPEKHDDDLWGFVHDWLAGYSDGDGLTSPESPGNVWLGVSVEDQDTADKRIPQLLRLPAKIRFLSVEPLLERINFRDHFWATRYSVQDHVDYEKRGGVHWVIFSGESGRNARPCNVGWIRIGKDQCEAAGVPCFVKQIGSKPVCDCSVAVESFSANCVQHFPQPIRDKKGGDWNEWPTGLRVREFPQPQTH